MNDTLTRIPGVLVGHATDDAGRTGVTAMLFPGGAVAAANVPGSATGTREMGVLDPSHLAERVHGFCFAGGSAFGLAAADGVMDVLLERGVGFDSTYGLVPLVPAAILFDLHTATRRPDRALGRAAAAAASDAPVPEGRVGAARGALAALATGAPEPGGVGSFAIDAGGHAVGALVAVNAVGSVWDPQAARWVCGGVEGEQPLLSAGSWRGQTTLVAVVTDAPVDRAQCAVIARMAAAGIARTLYPAFTPFDGDVVFAASTATASGADALTVARIGDAAARCVERAIVRAVTPIDTTGPRR